jgi:hypothetical protein
MFFLSVLDREPQHDIMPVIKTVFYPWARESRFCPLAYARLAFIRGRGLFVDLQAFERDPECSDQKELLNNSCVAVSFDLSPEGGRTLTVALRADGMYQMYIDGSPVEAAIAVRAFQALDELGISWNIRFYLPTELLSRYFSVSEIKAGHKIKGNIYKFQRAGKFSHMGAAADLKSDSIFCHENLADFTAVNY